MNSSLARRTLENAQFYADQAESFGTAERSAFEREIQAAIVMARSITQHIQKEYAHRPGFDQWWAPYQQMMEQGGLFKLFKKMRNTILKIGPIEVQRVVSVTVRSIVDTAVVVEAQATQEEARHRRSPNMIWHDFQSAAMTAIREWHRSLTRRHVLAQRQPSAEVAENFYFDEPKWGHRPALELVREYLHKLEEIVSAAEEQFGVVPNGREGSSHE